MDRGWMGLEVQAGANPCCHEWKPKFNSLQSPKGKETYRESPNFLKEYVSGCEQNVGRSIDGKGHSNEVSDRNEEYVIEHGRNAILVTK